MDGDGGSAGRAEATDGDDLYGYVDEEGELEAAQRDVKRIKEIYIFPFGCVVFWNFNERTERQILHEFERFSSTGAPMPINRLEMDVADFGFDDDDADISLTTVRDVMDRLTVSHVWSRSVKLQVFEERVDACIEKTKRLPITMAKGADWYLSQTEMNQLIGYLLLEKRALNLDMQVGMHDTPDFIYVNGYDHLEERYWRVADQLDLAKRANVLNQRLDILKDLTHLIKREMEFSALKRLELVVACLILFQIIVYLVWQIMLKDLFHVIDGGPISM
eukprot:TRINITY_DN16894_c0_g1_i1.p1 TRINITY_DN16894_c0_g1~~TRINITY_DN16894_c0_g1_i1.p1  ORF type:complete len:309 (+),score=82.92 TRINITY_DN16894_c0_g1_i1:101-928(+)